MKLAESFGSGDKEEDPIGDFALLSRGSEGKVVMDDGGVVTRERDRRTNVQLSATVNSVANTKFASEKIYLKRLCLSIC